MRTDVGRRAALLALPLALALLGFLPASAQTTVWVNDCAGTGTGTQGDPYCQIQTAICAIKATGGTINVLPGTYLEAIRVPANVSIISTDGPAVTTLNATGKPCVDSDFCTIETQTSCSAVYFPTAAGTTSRIEGIRITNTGGGTDSPEDFIKVGSGILVFNSSPTITRNEIVGNTITSPTSNLFYGGGIYINGTNPAAPARPIITQNLIQGNVADPAAGVFGADSLGQGGGIYIGFNASALITGNTIKANRVGSIAKSFQRTSGAGVANLSRVAVVETKISRNLITGNNSADEGGGLDFAEYIPPVGAAEPARGTVDNNVIDANIADDGGAMNLGETLGRIYNNTIHNNTARSTGAGVSFGQSVNPSNVAVFVNNLVTSNQATGSARGGGFWVDVLVNPTVRYNDLWGNLPQNVDGSKNDADYIGVNHGISVDPIYVDRNAVPPNYHLSAASPVIDAGDNTVTSTLPTDYDGAPRVQDGDYIGVATVDLGAFEFSPDFDGDGTPDWQDPDQDNDGVANASDCAPRNRAVSQIPDRVATTLRLDQSGALATLTWLHAYQAPTYNVYRGTLGGGVAFAYNETCFDTENAARTIGDSTLPPSGNGFYYIVGSRNSCGESAAVTNSQGLHHTPAPTCATAARNSDGDTPQDLGDNCPLATNASQGDVDGDSQGDACDNCASLTNIDQANTDGDGLGDACDPDLDGDGVANAQDCRPNDPSIWGPSGEVAGVVLTKGSSTGVSWATLSGGTTSYDLAGGNLALLRSNGSSSDASCLEPAVTGVSWYDPRPDPNPGSGYYYLVRGRNVCGAGSYGAATGGAARVPGQPCP